MGDDGAGDDRTKQFGAFFETEGFEAATNGVQEDVAGSFELDVIPLSQLGSPGVWRQRGRGVRTASSESIL